MKNYDFRFSYGDNLQIAIDKTVKQTELRRLLQCVFKSTRARSIIERVTGPIRFGQEVYHMYGNDHSFGQVAVKKDSKTGKLQFVAKMTAKIADDGSGKLFSLFVIDFRSDDRRWYRFKEGEFVREDQKCLGCHTEKRQNNFLFGRNFYKRIP